MNKPPNVTVVPDRIVHKLLMPNDRKRKRKFLFELDPSFRNVISQIINMKPLPSVDNAYSMITREELDCNITRNQEIFSKVLPLQHVLQINLLIYIQCVPNLGTLHQIALRLLDIQIGRTKLEPTVPLVEEGAAISISIPDPLAAAAARA